MVLPSFAFFAVLAAVFWALGNVLDKAILSDHIRDPVVVTFFTGGFAGLFSLALPLLGYVEIPSSTVLSSSLLGGILYIVPVYMYMKALTLEEVSRVVPIMNTSPVFVAMLGALFLSEIFTPMTYLGVLLAISGSVLVSSKKLGKEFFYLGANRAFWLVLAGTFLFAVYSVFVKWILGFADYWNVFFWTRMGGLIPVALLLLHSSTTENIYSAVSSLANSRIELVGTSELLNTLGVLAQTVALSLGPATLVKTVTTIQPFFVLLAVIGLDQFMSRDLGEDLSRKALAVKIVSGLMILVGIYLIL